jgi:hypothetical protein
MRDTVYVFVGAFDSRDAACQYSEQQWEPEPDVSASDQEYAAWEGRNPTWRLRSDLNCDYLRGDFVETITGDDRYDYLQRMLTKPDSIATIKDRAGGEANTLVLIFGAAFDGRRASMASTPTLSYCGAYPCDLSRL